ncbi:AsmA family protein [[Pseudomonas] carboxydohydrogena]|uniref:AsmA family protein n=1 Tax=Afipia carboxydohydrogena TaxID=290 RepID=UPI003B8337C6
MTTHAIRRLALPVAAVLGAVLAGLLASSWFVDRNAVRQAVETQIRDATGLELVVTGKTEVSLFPSARVVLHGVALKGSADSDAPLSTDQLQARLSLFGLIAGHTRVTDVALHAPRIRVTVDKDGHSNWAPIVQTFARAVKPAAARDVWFSDVRISDGTLAYRNARNQANETVGGIDLAISLPSSSRSFSVRGQSTWHNEQLEGSFTIADFLAAVDGEKSGLKVKFSGAPLKLSFDGSMTNRSSLLLDGTLTADTNSLRGLTRWAGYELPGGNGFGPFSLKARANVVGNSVALTNVATSLDGNAAEGVLTFNGSTGQQTLQGTLAADTLDLTPYLGTIRLLAGAHEWNRQAFDLRALSETSLDIRLSAAKVTIGSSKLGRTAFGANVRNGTLALSIGEAQMLGGIARGSLSVSRIDDGANVKAQFGFTDVDLEAGGAELFDIRSLRGRGDLNLTLEAQGASAFALTQTLDGSVVLTAHDGALSGFNVEQLLRRLERRPLSGAGSFRSGSTPFDTLRIAVTINDGMAHADDIALDGPATRVTLTGDASIPSREYDLKGTAALKAAAGAPPEFQLPFVVQGPWDDPLILPDSDILIRRSTVTAPLLDSLRDHKARDAVKAVIERLSGKKPAPPAPAAPPAAEAPAAAPQAN